MWHRLCTVVVNLGCTVAASCIGHRRLLWNNVKHIVEDTLCSFRVSKCVKRILRHSDHARGDLMPDGWRAWDTPARCCAHRADKSSPEITRSEFDCVLMDARANFAYEILAYVARIASRGGLGGLIQP